MPLSRSVRRLGLLALTVAVLAAPPAVGAGGTSATGQGGGRNGGGNRGSSGDSGASGAPRATAPAVVVTERQMLDETASLARAIGHARRSPFRIDWERRLVGARELRAAAQALVRGGTAPADVATDQRLLQRLGLLDAGDSYLDLVAGAVARDPIGFYDPSARRLSVANFIPLLEQRPTLAHEMAHALQDQRFGLRRLLKMMSDGRRGLSFDATIARQALIEGDAAVLAMEAIDPRGTFPPPLELAEMVQRARAGVANAFDRPGSSPERAEGSTPPSGPPPPPSSSSSSSSPIPPSVPAPAVPRFLRELLSFPFIDGFAFVARARATATWAAIDAIWTRPPESTAQILHPEKYDRRREPAAIELPPLPLMGDGLRLARADTLGELLIRIWLSSPGPVSAPWLSPEVAERAATGWRGDRIGIYLPTASDRPAPATAPALAPSVGVGVGVGGVAVDDATAAPASPGATLAWITVWDSDADADDFLQTVAPLVAALASPAAAGDEALAAVDAIDHPAVWRQPTGDSVFAVERRAAAVALLLGAPEAALPSLGTMLDTVSPRPGTRRPRPAKRERDTR